MSRRRDAALLLALLVASLAMGCFRSRTEATQVDAVARFMFTGNTSHAVVSLNQNGRAVWDDQLVSEGKRYEIKPGTYEVIVSRDGEMVVHRTLFVDQGKTVEVRIP
jgi:hypothetical protein